MLDFFKHGFFKDMPCKAILLSFLIVSFSSYGVAQSQQLDLAQVFDVSPDKLVTVSTAGSPRLSSKLSSGLSASDVVESSGEARANRAVLVEFSDVNCGYCIRFHKNTLPAMLTDFVETGQIDYVYKDYVSIGGQDSQDAALAMRCLNEHVDTSRYFQTLETLYRSLGKHGLKRLFEIMVIDFIDNPVESERLSESTIASIRECIESKQYLDSLSIEMMEAEAIGVMGTPVYVLGVETQQGRVEGIMLPGYLHYEVLAEHVEKILAVIK